MYMYIYVCIQCKVKTIMKSSKIQFATKYSNIHRLNILIYILTRSLFAQYIETHIYVGYLKSLLPGYK